MFADFPLFPEAASTHADKIDVFFFFITAVTGVVGLAVVLLTIFFVLRYRRRHAAEIPEKTREWPMLEYTWIVIPFLIFVVFFLWSSWIFFEIKRIPPDTLDIHVVAKQWMWKFQHPDGRSEINDLHLPAGRPVKLIMASEDVIHDFFVPEFRVHMDVLPRRYTYQWFEATKVGVYNLFCSEYCGTDHSKMIGKVYVMEPGEYQNWLAGGGEGSPADAGEELFQQYACNTCHTMEATARGPVLVGLIGRKIQLQSGQVLEADEAYIRESILDPRTKIVAGFEPIMPSFQGQLTEENVLQIIAYLKTLRSPNEFVEPVEAIPDAPSELESATPTPIPSPPADRGTEDLGNDS